METRKNEAREDMDAAGMPGAYGSGQLTPEEEKELGRRIKYGGTRDREDAKSEMVMRNMPLAMWAAARYLDMGLEYDDLVQEGAIGLMRAAEKFDADAGYRFSTYAMYWIRQAICRALDDTGRTIRVPGNAGRKIRKALQDPSPDGKGRPERYGKAVASLDMPVGEDGGSSLADLIPDEGGADPGNRILGEGLRTAVAECLDGMAEAGLASAEREAFEYMYGLAGKPECTAAEAAEKCGITVRRARDAEKKILGKLRNGRYGVRLREFI